MKKIELEILTFAVEDVIATSADKGPFIPVGGDGKADDGKI